MPRSININASDTLNALLTTAGNGEYPPLVSGFIICVSKLFVTDQVCLAQSRKAQRLEDGQKKIGEELHAVVWRLNKRMDGLRSEVNDKFIGLRSEMNGRFDDMNHRFDTLQRMFGLFLCVLRALCGDIIPYPLRQAGSRRRVQGGVSCRHASADAIVYGTYLENT